jgi:MGT family glycosyltransferase
VSLGTLFNTDAEFFRRCFDAFRGGGAEVIMSVGQNVEIDRLGTPPDNVRVSPFVDQLDVLAGASVFVTHGGMNSVSESLCCGVPMVVVPQMSEQRLVGRRVAELGAGLALDANASAADLRTAVDRVHREPRFRERAASVRQSFVDAGGIEAGVEAIRAFTRRH